ncbi:MAG TPA: hypothetical protein VGJ01_23960, partial [Pseudolabrys sp.]
MIFNVCLKKQGLADPQLTAWDRLVNRIERTMRGYEERELPKRGQVLGRMAKTISSSDLTFVTDRLNQYGARAVIIADQGREGEIKKAMRRMHVYNPIPSQFREWSPGQKTKNITTDRIIE